MSLKNTINTVIKESGKNDVNISLNSKEGKRLVNVIKKESAVDKGNKGLS